MIFFFKKKTAYDMLISDWSSDVWSSDLRWRGLGARRSYIWAYQALSWAFARHGNRPRADNGVRHIGAADLCGRFSRAAHRDHERQRDSGRHRDCDAGYPDRRARRAREGCRPKDRKRVG